MSLSCLYCKDADVDNIYEWHDRLVQHLHDSAKSAEHLRVTKRNKKNKKSAYEIFQLPCQHEAKRAAGNCQLTSELAKPRREAIKEDLKERQVAVLANAAEARESLYKARWDFANLPPGDINILLNSKIVFNAPYDDKHTYHIKITNSSARRVVWAIKTTNMRRLGVAPACSVLNPKQSTLIAVSCDVFIYGREDTNNDCITVEWCNIPDGAEKQFRREWFQEDGMMSRRTCPLNTILEQTHTHF
ncbi:MSP domain protein [Ancylostoma duodenale]|uniref:Major sperm protein n=1 Tax=Ancylostoma duodenale TaxID=51022 RepID=A0A0C2D1V5_9BILA|nr:MSP domain protein [Ancylostoma duodenale]